MPAKTTLTKAQFEALGRIEGTFDGVSHVNYFVYQSLANRRYFTSNSDGSWALTPRAKEAVYAYMRENPDAVYAAHTLTPQQIALYQGNPENTPTTPAITEPDHSDDDTKPLEPVHPELADYDCPFCKTGVVLWRSVEDKDGVREESWECERCGVCEDAKKPSPVQSQPLKTTFNLPMTPDEEERVYQQWLDETVPPKTCSIRDQYRRAYRWERAFEFDGYSEFPDIADIPADVAIAAHESLKARQQPDPVPFIVRAWHKRMQDAHDALQRVPLMDNAGFNNAVLDFKIAKARFMSIEERWELRQAAGARR